MLIWVILNWILKKIIVFQYPNFFLICKVWCKKKILKFNPKIQKLYYLGVLGMDLKKTIILFEMNTLDIYAVLHIHIFKAWTGCPIEMMSRSTRLNSGRTSNKSGGSNGIETQNHLVFKRTLNHLAKLANHRKS